MDSLVAKHVLMKAFGCAGLATDDQILKTVHDVLTSSTKLQFGSFTANACLTRGGVDSCPRGRVS